MFYYELKPGEVCECVPKLKHEADCEGQAIYVKFLCKLSSTEMITATNF